MSSLLLPERELIDCIKDQRELNIEEVMAFMSFNKKFILKIIENLKTKNILHFDSIQRIKLNQAEIEKVNTNKENLEEEVSDILRDLFRAYLLRKDFVMDFVMEGIWMSPFEEKLLQCKKAELTSLLSSMRKNRPKVGFSKKLIVYAGCDYSRLSRFSVDSLGS